MVLEKLKKNNVSINFNKSQFAVDEVKYLGYIINKNGIKADISRINKLKNIRTPKSKKDIQKLLGFINRFRPYIPSLS